MDFTVTDSQIRLKEEIAQFAKNELPQGYRGVSNIDAECPDFDFESAMSEKLARKGWLVMSWPKEYGGMEAGLEEQTVYEIELGYWRIPGAFMGVSGVQWVGHTFLHLVTEEQKQKYLPLIASGKKDGYWCTGYSEPNAGSDLANLQTRAVRQGDCYIVNGQKVWTSFAHKARWCWLMTRTGPQTPKKHQGLTLFIVDMKSPGITVRPLPNYYGRHHFNEVFFDDVKVPAANLVGQENKGWYHLMQALVFERRSIAPTMYGGFKRQMEELVDYVKKTTDGKYLSQNPEIRRKLADLMIDIDVLRLFAFELTWKITKGAIPTYESSRNKLLVDEISRRLSFVGADILGANSQIDPFSEMASLGGSIQSWYLAFPSNHIAAGTAEIEKSIIAQFRLGLPKSY
jgi:alkylation response protein AidB-like acyl-CoA dehydrogenase